LFIEIKIAEALITAETHEVFAVVHMPLAAITWF